MIQRKQLGEEIDISVVTTDSSGTPSTPTSAPTLRIYNSSFTKVETILMPPSDYPQVIGKFAHTVLLGWSYAVGRYSWRASYTAGGSSGVQSGYFEIVEGGNADGSIIAIAAMQNPDGTVLVQHTDNDTFLLSRNPRA